MEKKLTISELKMIREDFFRMIWEIYGIEPDYPFAGDFETAVFRRKDNLKWFAVCMSIASEKIGVGALGDLDIVNLKCTDDDRERLAEAENVRPAYHMNKKRWLTVILDENDEFDPELITLVQKSYELTSPKRTKSKRKKATEI